VYDLCGICTGGNTGRTPETELCNCPGLKTETVIITAACDSFVSASGNYIWKISGSYTDTLQSAFGCDSVLLYELIIENPSESEIEVTACGTYLSPGGKTWTEPGIYTDTIPNASGCDSILTITLNIPEIDVSLNQSEDTLYALATDVQYRWLDCNSSFDSVAGASGQSFTPTESGSYAVEITKDGCTDTSECRTVMITAILFNSFGKELKVFPNPAGSYVTIQMPDAYDQVNVELRNTSGAAILKESYRDQRKFTVNLNASPGVYFLSIQNENKQKAIMKLVVRY